jgi:hypothetical protein
MVALDYMALHGEQGNVATAFPGNGLGVLQLDGLTALTQYCKTLFPIG